MSVAIPAPGPLRDRLLVALADPEVTNRTGRTPAALVALHGALAVFEWIGTGKGLVLLEGSRTPPDALRAQLGQVVAAHERGVLFIAVAGGGPEVAEAMRAVDAAARNRDLLGFYHLDETGSLRRIAGRRLPELEQAARSLPDNAELTPDDVTAIMERGRRERLDAMEFVRSNARRFPRVTIAYMAICVLFYALTAGGDPRALHVYALLANNGDALRHGEVWRLLSYAVLHSLSTPAHLLVNMLSLYSLGGFVEPMLGRRRIASIYVLTALAGGILSALFTRADSVGASGAVWGLLGATLGLLGGGQPRFPALIARGLRRNLIVNLLINVGISFMPGIDRYCHFGGGIAGYLLGRLYARKRG